MSKYEAGDFPLHEPNHSQSVIVDLIGPDKHVLDVGCATGYTARALISLGCTVSGIEYDAEAAEKARDILDKLVIGDLAEVDMVAEFGAGTFDAVIFGDVLEHLVDPHAALRQARQLLKPGGSLVVSIPNVAHGDLRLLLLQGRWDYRTTGLLDSTHVRFFTRDGVRDLLAETGFVAVDSRRVRVPLFGSELGVHPGQVPAEAVEFVKQSPEFETYQFVVRALLNDADGAVEGLSARQTELEDTILDLERRTEHLQHLLDAATAYAERLENQGTRRVDELIHDIDAIRATRMFRYTEGVRAAYGRLRRAAL